MQPGSPHLVQPLPRTQGKEGAIISRERSPQACTQELGDRAEGQQRGHSYFMFPSFFCSRHKPPSMLDRQTDEYMDG